MSDAKKSAPAQPMPASPSSSTGLGGSSGATAASAPAWARGGVAWPFKAAPSLAQRARRKP